MDRIGEADTKIATRREKTWIGLILPIKKSKFLDVTGLFTNTYERGSRYSHIFFVLRLTVRYGFVAKLEGFA